MKRGSRKVMNNFPLVKAPHGTTHCLEAERKPFTGSHHPGSIWQRQGAVRPHTHSCSTHHPGPITHRCMALSVKGTFQNNRGLAKPIDTLIFREMAWSPFLLCFFQTLCHGQAQQYPGGNISPVLSPVPLSSPWAQCHGDRMCEVCLASQCLESMLIGAIYSHAHKSETSKPGGDAEQWQKKPKAESAHRKPRDRIKLLEPAGHQKDIRSPRYVLEINACGTKLLRCSHERCTYGI
jgi:hypothetical protein